MTRKVFAQLLDDMNEQQNIDVVQTYISKKQQLDELTKEVKQLSELLKTEMKTKELNSVQCNGYKVTRTESQRITWKEDLLLDKVKTYNNPDLITQVEQVNLPALEQAIMDDIVDINDLTDCQTVTEVVSLRVSKVKEKQDE